MSRRDPYLTLAQMLAHAREVRELTIGKRRLDLDGERMLELSVLRLLEVIGEAATRLPDDIRNKHPDIPWRSIIGLRNRLIHAYDEIDLDIVWDILTLDIPEVIERLERILGDEESA